VEKAATAPEKLPAKTAPPAKPPAKPAEKPPAAKPPSPKKPAVDVKETERGQPIPRNLLE
jgi:hypothetical protein